MKLSKRNKNPKKKPKKKQAELSQTYVYKQWLNEAKQSKEQAQIKTNKLTGMKEVARIQVEMSAIKTVIKLKYLFMHSRDFYND